MIDWLSQIMGDDDDGRKMADVALSDSYVFIVKLHTNAALLVILVKIG